MALSRKIIDERRTYDPQDCTSVGWDIALWADGHISLQRRSRWQGGRNGLRFVSDPDYVNGDTLTPDIVECLVEKADEAFEVWDLLDWSDPLRVTRRGHVVR